MVASSRVLKVHSKGEGFEAAVLSRVVSTQKNVEEDGTVLRKITISRRNLNFQSIIKEAEERQKRAVGKDRGKDYGALDESPSGMTIEDVNVGASGVLSEYVTFPLRVVVTREYREFSA